MKLENLFIKTFILLTTLPKLNCLKYAKYVQSEWI